MFNLRFLGCRNTMDELIFAIGLTDSILIKATVSNLILSECTFENNTGNVIVISARYSNITIAQSTFKNNRVTTILSYIDCDSKIVDSTVISNEGVLVISKMISVATFSNTFTLIRCEFRNNSNIQYAIVVRNLKVSITDTIFTSNRAEYDLSVHTSVVSIDKSVFKHNYGSVITLKKSTVNIFDSVYDSNRGAQTELGSSLSLYNSVCHIHSCEFKNNVASSGGAIFCDRSSLVFYGISTLTDNHARRGGAIYLDNYVQCLIAQGATVIIANNTASSGGGIHLNRHSNISLHTQSMLQVLENTASRDGGGIYLGYHSNLTAYTTDS